MSSYYNKVDGNLKPREIARVEDIHQIQQNIREAIQNLIKDNLGVSYILGESENTFKLIPTTDYIDQFNYYNGQDDDSEQCWVSFYDIYLKQDIEIEKSSIENITVHMRNHTNISVTIYAEIRDDDFHLISEANAILNPLDGEKYTPITFAFNKDHLPVGHYYFIIRPVDISVTDLALNEGDDNRWYESQILPEHFQVRYDKDGTYNKDFELTINNINDEDEEEDITINNTKYGLQASYDGTNYLDAIHLEEIEGYIDSSEYTKNDNIDLFFEETYSSGLTYLLSEPGAAIINGEKVESFDTHVKINAPSDKGDRIDLVMLTPEGELRVLEGAIGGEIYPTTNDNLAIAYIKLYKDGEKVAVIEQDDENGITRHRDILERIRRLEKKINYQVENNTPSRIKYTCTVDPIVYNDGLSQGTIDNESTYNLKLGTDGNGQPIVTNEETDSLIWSIMKGSYKYSHDETVKTSAYAQVFNVDMRAGQTGSPSVPSNGLYVFLLSESNLKGNTSTNIKKPIKSEKVKVEIKKSKSIKYSKMLTTNSKGQATLNLRNAKLAAGSYTVVSTIEGQTIQTTLKVHNGSYTVNKSGSTVKKINLKTAKITVTEPIKNKGISYGDEGFIKENVSVDTDNGVIQIAKQSNKNGKYVKNKALSDNKSSKPYFKSEIVEYTINSNKESLKSEFPVLHLNFTRDTHIKSITPYVRKFKNIKSFGILLFKNDQILNQKNKKRTLIEKNFNKDSTYPNIFKGSKNVTGKADKKGVVVLDSYNTFKTNIKLKAGTYSLVIFAKLKDNSSEGKIYLKEFDTYGNLDEYGMSAKSTGSSNLSLLKMHTNNLTSRSWNVVFEQKPDIYFEQGTITSASKTLDGQIKSCRPYFKNNMISPTSACEYRLQVSNNGGSTWENAYHGKTVNFKSLNNVFKWRLILTGDKKHTPRLVYNKNLQYAIKFSVKEQSTFVEYEDFGQCYQTPLFNAQNITRSVLQQNSVYITNRFKEWEFARIFMEDDSDTTNIDICFSYNDDDFKTGVTTYRDNWDSRTFFSQIFADLKLSDFNTSSVDYDNYEGNVEFDEHNYPFKVDPDALVHESGAGGHAIANFTATETSQFKYGNINNDNIAPLVDEWFVYQDVTKDYEYTYLAPEETKKYSGAVLTEGPYELATFSPKDNSITDFSAVTDDDKTSYIINGVRFKDPVILKGADTLTTQIYASRANGEDFPAGTFEIVVSLSEDGSLFTDNTNGIAYPINSVLEHDKYNSIGVYLGENAEGYITSGIRSVGIRVKNPEELKVGDSIGIGFMSVYGYNMRPYVPYLYTGNWNRLKWQPLVPQAKAYSLIKSQSESTGYWYEFYYSMQDNDPTQSVENNITTDGLSQYACHFYGTSSHLRRGGDGNGTSDFLITNMKRNRGQFTATMRQNNGTTFKCKSTNQGNPVILDFPAQQSGDIFKIDMNVPFSSYDLIAVEYYIYNTRELTNESEKRGMDNYPIYRINEEGYAQDDNYQYEYHGHFSKGDIKVKLYAERDTSNEPVEVLNLPPWGRTSQNATITDKTVTAWFKKRSDTPVIKSMVIERANPTGKYLEPLRLVLKNVMFYTADAMPALGPQMLMRIYPGEGIERSTLQIRKTGGIYRL